MFSRSSIAALHDSHNTKTGRVWAALHSSIGADLSILSASYGVVMTRGTLGWWAGYLAARFMPGKEVYESDLENKSNLVFYPWELATGMGLFGRSNVIRDQPRSLDRTHYYFGSRLNVSGQMN